MNVLARNPWICIFTFVSVFMAAVAIFKVDGWISAVAICSAELFMLYNFMAFVVNCMRRKYKQAFLRIIAVAVVMVEIIVDAKFAADRYQDRLESDSEEFKRHVEWLEIM